MAQLFPRSANSLARVSLAGAIVVPGLVLLIGSTLSRSPFGTKAGVPLDQPVPFSHKHHVEELGLDCRYCHTSVETSAVAGVPPTQTCMACHSQIWTNSPLLEPVRQSFQTGQSIEWNLVNDVPDFVYFDHSIHVNKGVGCSECHGPVHDMLITYKQQPFHMAWCLDCHRQPEKRLRTKDKVFDTAYVRPPDQAALGDKLVKDYHVKKGQLTDCWICHR